MVPSPRAGTTHRGPPNHIESYARDLEARGLAPATVALKLVVLTGWYRYCVEEQLLDHSPAVHVRRPKVAQESTRLGLDRSELGAFLMQAGLSGGNDHVLACLLALNALRVSEACDADLGDLALANGRRTLRIVGKGNQPALIPLPHAPLVRSNTAVAERTDGPLLARPDGSRLDRHAAARWPVPLVPDDGDPAPTAAATRCSRGFGQGAGIPSGRA